MPEEKEESSLETSKLQESKILDSSQNSKRILKSKDFDSAQKSKISDKTSEKEEGKEAKKEKGEKEEKEKIDAERREKIEGEEKEKTRKRESKRERVGIAYIYTSFNNTILHITDMAGNTIARVSGGMVTKHDRLKANPTIAMFVAKQAAEKAKELGINSLYVRIKAKTGSPAPGPGAHAAVKSLSREGFKVISIADTTKVPRGGPKPPHGRRGRRV